MVVVRRFAGDECVLAGGQVEPLDDAELGEDVERTEDRRAARAESPGLRFEQELVGRLLGLPADRRCHYLLSFGYPADPSQLTAPKKRGGRKPLAEVVHEERW